MPEDTPKTVAQSCIETTAAAISVIIVCAVRMYREAVVAALDNDPLLVVVGQGSSMADGPRLVQADMPDVVVVDFSWSDRDNLQREILNWPPDTRTHLVAMGLPRHRAAISMCLASGVRGIVDADATAWALCGAVRVVAGGGTAVPATRSSGRSPALASTPSYRNLTPREFQVLALLERGMSNREIAECLYVEVSTVKNHVHNLLAKIGARRRSEAVAHTRSCWCSRPMESHENSVPPPPWLMGAAAMRPSA